MKKIRGKRRKIIQSLAVNILNIAKVSGDFDMWHFHFAPYCSNKIEWKYRKLLLGKMIEQFNIVKKQMQKYHKRFQVYCCIDLNDDSYDCLYINTEVGNKQNYPLKLEMKKNPKIPDLLRNYISNYHLSMFIEDSIDANFLIIFDPDYGDSLL